jgi:hypothetical protein
MEAWSSTWHCLLFSLVCAALCCKSPVDFLTELPHSKPAKRVALRTGHTPPFSPLVPRSLQGPSPYPELFTHLDFPTAGLPNGTRSVVPDIETFKRNFNYFTSQLFEGFDWTNMIVAGTVVCACVLGGVELQQRLPAMIVAVKCVGLSQIGRVCVLIRVCVRTRITPPPQTHTHMCVCVGGGAFNLVHHFQTLHSADILLPVCSIVNEQLPQQTIAVHVPSPCSGHPPPSCSSTLPSIYTQSIVVCLAAMMLQVGQ